MKTLNLISKNAENFLSAHSNTGMRSQYRIYDRHTDLTHNKHKKHRKEATKHKQTPFTAADLYFIHIYTITFLFLNMGKKN